MLWFTLIFIPLIFFFLLKNPSNLKPKIIRTILFFIGDLLGFVILFFYIIFQCGPNHPSLYPTKSCMQFNLSLIPTLIFILILSANIIYLIFRFIIYLKNKNTD